MVYNNILELVGKTPMVRLDKFKENNKLNFNVFGKLESFNPAGSSKDRVAHKIIEDAEKEVQDELAKAEQELLDAEHLKMMHMWCQICFIKR